MEFIMGYYIRRREKCLFVDGRKLRKVDVDICKLGKIRSREIMIIYYQFYTMARYKVDSKR
jgi:hypothetical protein